MYDETHQSFLQSECEKHGFDISHTVHTSLYNELIEKEGHVQSGVLKKLPCPGTTTDTTTSIAKVGERNQSSSPDEAATKSHNNNAFLIGNTKTIWPFFIEWLSSRSRFNHQQQKQQHTSSSVHNRPGEEEEREGDREEDAITIGKNPFDAFCNDMIRVIVENFYDTLPDDGICFDIFLSGGKRYKMIPCTEDDVDVEVDVDVGISTNTKKKLKVVEEEDNFLVSMQRVATLTGSYWYDDVGSKLCVHPEYGTWHAFRAVVVISNELSSSLSTSNGNDQPIAPPPPMIPCPITQGEIDDCKKLMEYALRMSSPNDDTSKTDKTIVIHDMEISNNTKALLLENCALEKVSEKVTLTTLGWIGIRDSISLGRANYRYDKEQLCYHYTGDVAILKKVLLAKLSID